jgi:hypothetical protein
MNYPVAAFVLSVVMCVTFGALATYALLDLFDEGYVVVKVRQVPPVVPRPSEVSR